MFTVAWLKDTAERTARTFAQGFLGIWIADKGSGPFDPTLWQTAGAAGVAAAIAVLMAIIAAPKGATISPASLVLAHPRRHPDAGTSALGVILAVLVVIVVLALFGAFHHPLILLVLLVALLLLLL